MNFSPSITPAFDKAIIRLNSISVFAERPSLASVATSHAKITSSSSDSNVSGGGVSLLVIGAAPCVNGLCGSNTLAQAARATLMETSHAN